MIKNYFILALRNIFRHKIFSLINLLGLAIGMAVCLLILFWIEDEFSFDRFNQNFKEIYRVAHIVHYEDQIIHSSKTPHPLGPYLKEEFAGIEEFTRYGTFVGEVMLRNEDRAFYELGGSYVDPGFFKIFSVPLISGNAENIFPDKFSTVISRDLAKKYFGNEDPVGKSLILENVAALNITGVFENIPENSHLQTDFMVPFNLYEAWGGDLSRWDSWQNYTYILLQENVNKQEVDAAIKNVISENVSESKDEIYLQPLQEIHLFSNLAYDSPAVLGNINNVYLFASIALVILALGCINFINLTTAQSLKRFKEVGMRKVMGAGKKELIFQFLGETILMSVIAFMFSLGLAELLLPQFNRLTGKSLNLNILDIYHLLAFIGIIIITGIISGSYPAFFLSSFRPIIVLRNRFKLKAGKSSFKLILIIVQFVLSITLLISTLIIYDQLNFIGSKNLGFNRNHVIRIQSRPGMYQQYQVYKEQLLRNSQIVNVTATDALETPFNIPPEQISWSGKKEHENRTITAMQVDYDYLETLEIDLLAGRSFSPEFSSDQESAVILNEAAVEAMALENPLQETINYYGRDLKVIGIVKDYHANSLKVAIRPMLMIINQSLPVYIYVRINPEDISTTLKFIESEWQKIVPDFPFEFKFLDDMINNIYLSDKKIASIISSFTVLAILISALGLFGLASYAAEVRTKEIGIRKVMGAKIRDIVWLLSSEFSQLVILANFFAWPLAYFLVRYWLQNFAYKVNIKLSIFLLAGLGSLFIALFTVSFQTVKAALSNPAKALKYE